MAVYTLISETCSFLVSEYKVEITSFDGKQTTLRKQGNWLDMRGVTTAKVSAWCYTRRFGVVTTVAIAGSPTPGYAKFARDLELGTVGLTLPFTW